MSLDPKYTPRNYVTSQLFTAYVHYILRSVFFKTSIRLLLSYFFLQIVKSKEWQTHENSQNNGIV